MKELVALRIPERDRNQPYGVWYVTYQELVDANCHWRSRDLLDKLLRAHAEQFDEPIIWQILWEMDRDSYRITWGRESDLTHKI